MYIAQKEVLDFWSMKVMYTKDLGIVFWLEGMNNL